MDAPQRKGWVGWMVLALALLLWESAARSSSWLQFYIPPVSQILSALFDLLISGQVAVHCVATLGRFLIGYFIAAAVAVGAGIVLGYFRFIYSLFEMAIEFLRPMPSVAIIPVAVLILGIGDAMIVAVTVYASAWPIIINTIDGVRHIDPTLIATGRTFGLRGWRLLWRIVLPGALPYVVTGLRISLAIALIIVTTAEMVVGSKGLGFFILDEERSLRNTTMYAGIILISMLGYLLNRFFLRVEGVTMKWHRGMAERQLF